MELNAAGRMVKKEWNQIPQIINGINIDKYVIMPNHFRGIIQIVGTPLVGVRFPSNRENSPPRTGRKMI